jgi:hypothetical protein
VFIIGLLVCTLATVSCTAGNFVPAEKESTVQKSSITIERQADVTSEEVAELQQMADETTLFFTDANIRLEKSITIVLTRDRKAYISEVISRFKISEFEAAKVTKGTDAIAGKDLIIVNLSGVPTPRQKTFLIAHEMTHHYQRQLAGDQAGKVKWMLEGMAESVGAQVVARKGYMNLVGYKNNWLGGLKTANNKPRLFELRSRDGWSNAISQYGSGLTYKTAGVAVLLLTERFGQQKVLDYFVELGQGESPETSFQRVFGVKMTDFESELESLLRRAS